MGAKKFRTVHDWVRHGMNIHLTCINGHCSHTGVADAWCVDTWFRLHRWPQAVEAAADRRFRCTACGSKGAHMRPTDEAPTILDFFPADDRGWKALVRRLRG